MSSYSEMFRELTKESEICFVYGCKHRATRIETVTQKSTGDKLKVAICYKHLISFDETTQSLELCK